MCVVVVVVFMCRCVPAASFSTVFRRCTRVVSSHGCTQFVGVDESAGGLAARLVSGVARGGGTEAKPVTVVGGQGKT
jgi:hypothetical protein